MAATFDEKLEQLVGEAADLLRPFNEELANAFLNEPFRRVDLALAFASGFAKEDTDDIHPTASLVLRVALFDRDSRRV